MIGERIKKIRKEKGITLSELADRANMSKSYLSNIERNINQNPSIHLLERISSVLNVSLHILVDTAPEAADPAVREWNSLINEMKEVSIDQEKVQEYKAVLEFIKWQNQQAEKE